MEKVMAILVHVIIAWVATALGALVQERDSAKKLEPEDEVAIGDVRSRAGRQIELEPVFCNMCIKCSTESFGPEVLLLS